MTLTSKVTVLQKQTGVLTTWHTILEKYLVCSSPQWFLHNIFRKLKIKKSLQMLRESRHENLKILIAPLNIKLLSLKSTGAVPTLVMGLNN